jgi:hypothetical protein
MLMPSDRSNIDEASSQNIPPLSKHQEQLQFVNNQEIVQYVLSQPDIVTQLARQFNELNLISPIVTPHQQHFSQSQSFKIEISDNETSIQTKQELPIKEKSADYFESSPSSLHSVRLVRISTLISLHCKNRDDRRRFASFQHKTSTNSLVVESTPACCTELVGLTLETTREYGNNQSILFFS